jgi:two-component system chemotaxis response regulator CheY
VDTRIRDMKILIVDDDAACRGVLHKIISSQPDHQITMVDSGAAAWALLDDPLRIFDVVFLDLSMPEMDGFALLQKIRASPVLRSLEVVLCTGSNDRTTVVRAVQLGVRHYLVKPAGAAAVHAKLEQLRPAEATLHERSFVKP